jgi:carbonic anhydrase
MYKIFSILVAALILAGCSTPGMVSTHSDAMSMTPSIQKAMTADQALARLKAGNGRFMTGEMLKRDLPSQVKVSSKGQYPFASVVSCLDSRASAELVFDQGIGDVFSARVAGNIINDDIIGSLEFGSKVAGAKVIVILGHTSCGAIKGACDDVALGNLTGLLAKIKPAISNVSYAGDRSSKNDAFVEMVSESNVRRTVQDLLARSPVLRDMQAKGEVKIVGAMLDVATGKIAWY